MVLTGELAPHLLFQAGSLKLVRDSRNQLSSVTAISPGLAATYDGLTRRPQAASSGVATSYLFDGSSPVRLSGGSAGVRERLTVGGEMLTFSSTPSGQGRTDWVPLLDANGSTIAHVNSNGTLVNQYTYDPSGITSSTGGSVPDPFLFNGMEQDATLLYHAGGRYHSPRLSRSISEIGPQSGGGGGSGGNGGGGGGAGGPSGGSGGSPNLSNLFNPTPNPAYSGIGAGAALATYLLLDVAIIDGGLAFGPASWPVAAVGLAVVEILQLFDVFGDGQPEVNHKRLEPGHSIPYWAITDVRDDSEVQSQQQLGHVPFYNRPGVGYNYCGADQNPGNPKATDPTDVCCKAHDICYGKAGLSGADVNVANPGLGAGPEQRACDAALMVCLHDDAQPPLSAYERQVQGNMGRLFGYDRFQLP